MKSNLNLCKIDFLKGQYLDNFNDLIVGTKKVSRASG
jgi:hypothetical protein